MAGFSGEAQQLSAAAPPDEACRSTSWAKICCCDFGGSALSNVKSTLYWNILFELVSVVLLLSSYTDSTSSHLSNSDINSIVEASLAIPLNAVIYFRALPARDEKLLNRLQIVCCLVAGIYVVGILVDLLIEGAAGLDRKHYVGDTVNDLLCFLTWCQVVYWVRLLLLEWRSEPQVQPAVPNYQSL